MQVYFLCIEINYGKIKNIIVGGNEKMKHNKLTKVFICIGIIAIIIFMFIVVNKAISTQPVEVVEPEQLEIESISESEEPASEEISTESAGTENLQENTSNINEPAQEIEVQLTDEEVIDESVEPEPPVVSEESEAPVADYTVEPITATMYATQTVNVRDLPSTEGNKVGSKSYAESVEVTGQVTSYKGEKCLWYQLSDGTFVSGNYLTDTKPAVATNTPSNNNSNPSTSTPSNNNSSNDSSASSSNSGAGGISQEVWDAFFSDNGGDSTPGGDASAGGSSGGGAHID